MMALFLFLVACDGSSTPSAPPPPDPSVLGASYTVSWTLSVVLPGGGSPSGNVTVNDGEGHSCSVAVATGSCTIPTSTSVGSKTLTYSYPGDSNFNGISATATHAVQFGFAGLGQLPVPGKSDDVKLG